MKVTSKHTPIHLIRCVQIATPSVPYFPRLAQSTNTPQTELHFIYIDGNAYQFRSVGAMF
jgi:hypothetical protein